MRKAVQLAVSASLFAVPGSEDGEDGFSKLHVGGLRERRGGLALVGVEVQAREIAKRHEIQLALLRVALHLGEISIEMP